MAYSYYRTLTIDKTKVSGSANITDYPMLVAGTYADLKTTGNGGDVQNASGYDIAFFSDSALTTQLDHEVEVYTATTGKIAMWVRIPTLHYETNDVIYMAYGDSGISTSQENITGVWESGYKGVWHFHQDPSGSAPQILDSTSNNNDGTSNGTMTDTDLVDDGFGGKALDFDGSNDYINCGHNAVLNITGDITIENFLYYETLPTYNPHPICKGEYNSTSTYSTWLAQGYPPDSHAMVMGIDGSADNTLFANTGLNASTSYFHVCTFEPSANTRKHYLQGDPDGSSTSITVDPTGQVDSDLWIGSLMYNGGYLQGWKGRIGEMRIYAGIRTAGQIKTMDNNYRTPSTFYAVGDETEAGGETPARGFLTTNSKYW